MSELFLRVVNMSISAGWLVLALLVCRLALKKAPKWVNVLLWSIVAVRLLLPFPIESALSLIPSAETISPNIMMDPAPSIHTGIPALNSVVNPVISQAFAPPKAAVSINPLQVWIPVFACIWAVGVIVLLAYTAVSYWRLRRKVRTAVLLRDNIFQSEHVSSPFVLGVIRPRIYLSFNLDGRDMENVVAHEMAHISRRDHWWKPLGFLLLTVYWFNPLMWLAYVLLCRDIELACDEKVIRELENEQRADYTQALLTCSVSRRTIAACPLAFGEVGVKERVKSVMNYKSPTFRMIVTAVIVCAVVAVCFLTNPAAQQNEIEMIPTAANVQGVFDSYLYVPFADGTYRYEESNSDPSSVTIGELLYSFTEKADPFDVEWKVYEVKEYPDHQIVCTAAGGSLIRLYQYSPSKRVDSNALQEAKESGCVVMEDGSSTCGAEQWKEFYEMTQNGKSGSVKLARYWTLDPDRCDATYYEVYKEDYPSMYVYDLAYNGKTFTISWTEQGASYQRQYKFLMKYEDTIPSYLSSQPPRAVTRYVLTNDNTVTWDELVRGLLSSRLGDYIDHFSVYTDTGGVEDDEATPALSLDDVIALSQKGYELSWADFEKYDHIDTGSGLYIWIIEIDERFSLMLGGGSMKVSPIYIYLVSHDGPDTRIDIRDGEVEEFIELHKDAPVVIRCNAAWQCSPVGYSEELFSKMIELGGASERFLLSGIQYLPVVRIDSGEELRAVMEKLSPYANLELSYPDTPAFSVAAENYDDSFFETSTLFLIYTTESMGGIRHSVEYVNLSQGTLSIGIQRLRPEAGNAVMEGWLIAVSVPTAQITGAEETEAHICYIVTPDGHQ